MKSYVATVRVVHMETWGVDAENEAEARKKFSDLSAEVMTDETGGEAVDWEVYSLQEIDPDTGSPINAEDR